MGLFKKKKTQAELIAEEIQRRKDNIKDLENVIAYNNARLEDLKDVYINDRPTVYHTSPICSHIKPGARAIQLSKAKAQGLSICSHCNRG